MPVCIGGNSLVRRNVLATAVSLPRHAANVNETVPPRAIGAGMVRFPALRRDSPARSEASYTGTPMHVVVASHHRLPVEGYGGPPPVGLALGSGAAAPGPPLTILAEPRATGPRTS